MSDVLTPLSAYRPGLYQTVPVTDAMRARLNGTTMGQRTLRTRAISRISEPWSPYVVRRTVAKYRREYGYRADGYNVDMVSATEVDSQMSNTGYFQTMLVLPSSPDECFSLGPGGSALLGFVTPGLRRSRTVEYFARRERQRMQNYVKRRKLREEKFYKAQEERRATWEKRRVARIAALDAAIVRRFRAIERYAKAKQRYRDKIRWRRATGSRTARTNALVAKWNSAISELASKERQKQLQISELREKRRKVENNRFRVRQFQYPAYTPRFYDIVTGKLLAAAIPLSQPPAKGTVYPHPVDHVKSESGWPCAIPFHLRVTQTRGSEGTGYWYQTRESWELDASARFDRFYPSTWSTGRLWMDKGGRFDYSYQDVEDAVRSITYRGAPQESSILQFLVELDDIPKLISSLPRLIAAARRGVRRIRKGELGGFFDMARGVAGADLARKFGGEPMIRDLMVYSEKSVHSALRGWQQLRQLIRNRGQLLQAHRQVGDARVDTQTVRVTLSQMLPGLRSAPGLQEPIGRRYEYDMTNDQLLRNEEWDIDGFEAANIAMSLPYDVLGTRFVNSVCSRTITQKLTLFYSYTLTDLFGWEMDEEQIKRQWMLDRIGLFVDPKVVWDTIPFSFVLDWLVNIKSLIGQYEVRNLRPIYNVYGGMLSRKEELVIRPRLADYDAIQDTEIELEMLQDTYKFAHYQRQFVEISPDWLQEGKRVKARLQPPSWWKLITAAELLM